MAQEHHFTWEWDLQSSPETLWPFVSDTNRFNRDTGLPPIRLLNIEKGIRHVRFHFPLSFIEWDEEPFDWSYPYSFGIIRRYRKGPVAEMRVEVSLQPLPDHGTHLVYKNWFQARNFIGTLGILTVIGIFSKFQFGRIFHLYDGIAKRNGLVEEVARTGKLSQGQRARLNSLSNSLIKEGSDPILVEHLGHFIENADDLSLQRIRPYVLADRWGLPRRSVLETFLRATRLGLLDMSWDLLCPSCRGVAESNTSLGNVHGAVHCNTCNIDFTANFDHNVEVIFKPNPAVRSIELTLEFCVGSPQRQPHIVLMQTLWPREEMTFATRLDEGRYTLRASGLSGSRGLIAEKSGESSFEARAGSDGWPYGEARVSLLPRVRLLNGTQEPQTFQIERTAWSDQAATAADVTILQVFRDLFSTEVLRLGEELSVGSVTLMFTDLRDSTRLYRQIGDASAFGRVREHFEVLEASVILEGGGIVKTMGDSVMAAFRKPSAALKAVQNVQKTLTERDQGLWLKAGIHHGPCIVVNLNDRLDYFGSTVNIAARLPGFSNGGEVIFSESVRDDPEVVQFLEKNIQPNMVTRFSGDIKGYDQAFPLWRMKI